jgi:sulfur carrier protein
MEIVLNGKNEKFEQSNLTLSGLLAQKGIKNVEMVTVQLNGTFVDKNDLDSKTLTDNDEIDFLYFMGGGSQ